MKTWTSCRVCGGSLDPILPLGDQYVSTFLSPEQPDGPKAPLELVLCQQCRLLQLRHTVPGDMMYQNYWYRSGTNQTMRDALTTFPAQPRNWSTSRLAIRLWTLGAMTVLFWVPIRCQGSTRLA